MENEYKTFVVLGILAALWLAYEAYKRSQAATPSQPVEVVTNGAPNPQLSDFMSGPNAPSHLQINIANQGLSYLDNKYIPLFGFVGMAQ